MDPNSKTLEEAKLEDEKEAEREQEEEKKAQKEYEDEGYSMVKKRVILSF